MFATLLGHLTAVFTILPIVSFLCIYVCLLYWKKDKTLALHWSIHITAILLLISIKVTVQQLWGVSIFWILASVLFIILIGLTLLQYNIRREIHYGRLITGALRLSFLLFLPIHVILYGWVVLTALMQSIE